MNKESRLQLLNTTYFGPVAWYQQLYRADRVVLEACETFTKQTYRNRCVIATANGLQTLTVPVEHGGSRLIRDVRISPHGSWRRVHWNALQSAYSESPFFEFYEDDVRPFFQEDYERLFDFNLAIIKKMCELLDIHPLIEESKEWREESNLSSPVSNFKPYYQVFASRHGFQPNLSILDLLFNMGPEGIFYL